MTNLQEEAVEYANAIYVIPFKQAYGKIFREIRENTNSLPKKKAIIYIDFLQERIDVLYEEHKLVCQKSTTCPHDILYQNLFNGISEIKKEQVDRMPWYKKTWVIFTILAAIVAFIASIIIAANNGFSLLDRFSTEEPITEEYIDETKDLVIKPSEAKTGKQLASSPKSESSKSSDEIISSKDIEPEKRSDYEIRKKAFKDFEAIDKKLSKLWFRKMGGISKTEYKGYTGGYRIIENPLSREKKIGIRHELYKDIKYENKFAIVYENHKYLIKVGQEKVVELSIFKEIDFSNLEDIVGVRFQQEIDKFVNQ